MSVKSEQKRYDLLNKFANSHTLATDIMVTVGPCCKSFKPRPPSLGARYEDANLLASIIMGAESFLYWCERNNYEVRKVKK